MYKHTYDRDVTRDDEYPEKYRIKAPMWLVILVVLGLLIPIINFAVFGLGAFFWCMIAFEQKDIVLRIYPTSKFGKRVKEFLNKEV